MVWFCVFAYLLPQFWGQQFALWPRFSGRSKKNSCFFNLFGFLLVRMGLWLLSFLHARQEIRLQTPLLRVLAPVKSTLWLSFGLLIPKPFEPSLTYFPPPITTSLSANLFKMHLLSHHLLSPQLFFWCMPLRCTWITATAYLIFH